MEKGMKKSKNVYLRIIRALFLLAEHPVNINMRLDPHNVEIFTLVYYLLREVSEENEFGVLIEAIFYAFYLL